MSDQLLIPSVDPANTGELMGVLQHVLGKTIQNLDGMLPAQVVSFDRAKNRVSVKPLIMVLGTDGSTLSRAQINGLPVYQLGGGGFVLSFNLSPGDLGWIKASDRDISLFLQAYKEAAPNTLRKHSFSDAVFYPDVMTGYTIAGEDAGNAVLQNKAGTVKISLSQTSINMVAPGGITINGVTIDAGGAIATPGDVVAGGQSLQNHTHPYTWSDGPGSGNTGAPN